MGTYFFRVVADGDSWVCRRGSRVLHSCDTYAEAIFEAEREAVIYRPAQVLVYDELGRSEVVARYDAAPD